MERPNKNTVVISGYFNPLHVGHLDYILSASTLGDKLIAIVNNDLQIKIKGSQVFMTEEERAYIVSSIKGVDEVIISIDEDESVCGTLELLCPDIFAKGGDRNENNIPEKETCNDLGIQMMFCCGGEKIQSSSELLSRAKGDKNECC